MSLLKQAQTDDAYERQHTEKTDCDLFTIAHMGEFDPEAAFCCLRAKFSSKKENLVVEDDIIIEEGTENL